MEGKGRHIGVASEVWRYVSPCQKFLARLCLPRPWMWLRDHERSYEGDGMTYMAVQDRDASAVVSCSIGLGNRPPVRYQF